MKSGGRTMNRPASSIRRPAKGLGLRVLGHKEYGTGCDSSSTGRGREHRTGMEHGGVTGIRATVTHEGEPGETLSDLLVLLAVELGRISTSSWTRTEQIRVTSHPRRPPPHHALVTPPRITPSSRPRHAALLRIASLHSPLTAGCPPRQYPERATNTSQSPFPCLPLCRTKASRSSRGS
jgi:hypothetical protein